MVPSAAARKRQTLAYEPARIGTVPCCWQRHGFIIAARAIGMSPLYGIRKPRVDKTGRVESLAAGLKTVFSVQSQFTVRTKKEVFSLQYKKSLPEKIRKAFEYYERQLI